MGGNITYMTFAGARAQRERELRGTNPEVPLVITSGGLVLDCDEKAWRSGVRPGDTQRQAQISAPACHVLKSGDDGPGYLKAILDALANFSPLLEPSEDGGGVFIDLPGDVSVASLLPGMKGLFSKVIAGSSKSKMLAKSAALWLYGQYMGTGKIVCGKTSWGFVLKTDDCLWASIDNGKEKSFLANAPLQLLWPVPAEVILTLTSLGLKKVKDLQKVSTYDLSRQIGDWACLIKQWAAGEDKTTVKPLYPPLVIKREVNPGEPLMPHLTTFEPHLASMVGEMISKGLGFQTLELSITGESLTLTRKKRLSKAGSSLESMRLAVEGLLKEMIPGFLGGGNGGTDGTDGSDGSDEDPASLMGFCIVLSDLVQVFSKPLSLFDSTEKSGSKAIPVSLGLALDGLEGKFGHSTITWGKKDKEDRRFKPEIMRREQMLSIWDPMRAGLVSHAEAADG